jgi:ubiquinone biosynthesis protein
MRRVRLLLRLLSIQRTLIRHGLDEVIWHTHLFRPIAWVQWLIPRPRVKRTPLGVRARMALEELGPLFVKFGQALSVRRDLLPPAIADELAKLQDQVHPFGSDEAVAILERAFGCPWKDVFADLDDHPLAAASIAQVHAAKLRDGREVVVKILRPNVRERVRGDLAVLFALAGLAQRYWPQAHRLRPVEVVAEFEKTLRHELDLMREAASASHLKRNFEGSDELYVPDVYWEYCRDNVLTMERISAIPISDRAALERAGTDIKRLAENGVHIFFTQVFVHNFFHADMHPGNIFVDVTDPARPRYVAVDFGIVGSLDERDQRYLAENFLAFFKRDYRRVARLHVDSGWVPQDTRVDELEAAIRAVCEPVFNKPLKEISFGLVLMRLLQTAREFNMQVQPQLVLLQKTLLAIEGLGRELYPELDLWRTAKPILESWMRERKDPRVQLKRLFEAWPDFGEDMLLLAEQLHRKIRDAERAQKAAPGDGAPRLLPVPRPHGDAQRFVGAALLLSGAVWSGLAAAPIWIGWAAAAAGLFLMLTAWRRR